MNTWVAVSEGLLAALFLMHAAARLWPKSAGYHYLRYNLSRRGITQIPPECIREFVDDAHDYACAVCTSRGIPGRIPHFEFERMLRVHSFVIHALLTGRTAAEMHAAEKGSTSEGIQTSDPRSPSKSGPSSSEAMLMRELIRCEMLRAGVDPVVDAAEGQRIVKEVRRGTSWDRHRAILFRHQLLTPIAGDAIGELSQ